MTTPTPASGTRRSVKVRVLRRQIDKNGTVTDAQKIHYHDMPSCHVITGYTGTAKSLKRLAEIAAMDELAITNIFWTEYNRNRLTNDPNSCAFMGLKAMLQALGLSPKHTKKAGRKST